MLTERDICMAAHALASLLRGRCTMDSAARSSHACPPLVALEELLRVMHEGGFRPQDLLSLNDWVQRAVRIQDPGMHDALSARLIKVLAGICKNRLALPESPDATSYV
jgi:hypothetical protein